MNIIYLHPKWVRKEAQSILSEMFSGRRDNCPLPLESKTGRLIPVETRVWFGKWSGVECVFGISKDLSKEQESLQKFEKLFRMNPALMAISRLEDRRFTDVNDAFLATLGYSLEEVIGKTGHELGIFAENAERERIKRLLSEYGNIRKMDIRIQTKDGHIREGIFSADILESQGSRYLLTAMADITDRKMAEAEREKTIEELQSALEQIRTLKGIIPICSHCKKIRDDKGYWEQVDAYVSRHTDVLFSHGVCPECANRYYGEYLTPEK